MPLLLYQNMFYLSLTVGSTVFRRRHTVLLFKRITEIIRICIPDFFRNNISLITGSHEKLHGFFHSVICQKTDKCFTCFFLKIVEKYAALTPSSRHTDSTVIFLSL